MSADAVVEAPPVATEVTAPAAPQRDPARLARILRNPGKDKPEPRPWRGDIAHNAAGSAYTWENVGVSAAFVADAVKGLSEEECERAAQGLPPLREEEKAMAERAARFGVEEEGAGGKKILAAGIAVDELAAAKRLARFGAIPEEPKKKPQQQQQQKKDGDKKKKNNDKKKDAKKEKNNGNNGGNKEGKKAKESRPERLQKQAEAVAAFFKAPDDDATKAAMAARAARFGAPAAAAASN
eukprot:CAMPEP_0174830632 /NCGR_PEP_ID=MMETSP1114-20130205/2630_1 /TAXON_ID=312471 /ORGANISM="Neobodo designis, Strain CCAP 1951/1" /LENGTH=238 /DNA_ID=CAMNT_0016064433 /DNA_START=40 /DNA_END=756 /DNA_ORIENTATION=-